MYYVFILGHNPDLSVAEILAVLPQAKVVGKTGSFLLLEANKLDCIDLLGRLGGTIKIGEIISQTINKDAIVGWLKLVKSKGKLNFGLSYYDCQADRLGMEVKKDLKSVGVSSRLVVGKEKTLSSVIVVKNKCLEFLILQFFTKDGCKSKWLARTCAVQDFEEYGRRDYGRPVRDMKSGSLPPKLAKIMINLAQVPLSAKILDPFCGSGTVLQEALLLGYNNISGSDISDKAISDTEENLEWLDAELGVKSRKLKIFQSDVAELSRQIKNIDVIITEPYLGPPLFGNESRGELEENIKQLSGLYLDAFYEFKKVLCPAGKVVMVMPVFNYGFEMLSLPILMEIKKIGFIPINTNPLIYGRSGQKVWRQIFIFQLRDLK